MRHAFTRYMNRTFRDTQRRNLVAAIAPLFPEEPCSVLDIGCGNGEFAVMLRERLPLLRVWGCEVTDRGPHHVRTTFFDGERLPFADGAFDFAMLINVLHHTSDPGILLREAARVSRRGIIVKDHYANSAVDRANLYAMEYMNPNFREISQLPLRFYSSAEWAAIFSNVGLACDQHATRFPSYGKHWDLLFGRGMHFVGRYRVAV